MTDIRTEPATPSDTPAGTGAASADAGHQQHPLRLYFLVWGLLFVLSIFSYMVDYFALEGVLRWSLILFFMLAKAGLIMAIFMHMAWERLALNYVILLPPLALLVFVAIMTTESGYTAGSRELYFTPAE